MGQRSETRNALVYICHAASYVDANANAGTNSAVFRARISCVSDMAHVAVKMQAAAVAQTQFDCGRG